MNEAVRAAYGHLGAGDAATRRSPAAHDEKWKGLKGSDPSVYALLYMLDFGAADVVDYAAS